MTTASDFADKIVAGDADLTRLNSAVNDAPGTFTTDNAVVVDNLRKRLQDIGYLPPVAFVSGLEPQDGAFTVTHEGLVYAADPADTPFTTTGTFDASQWTLVQKLYDVNTDAELLEIVGLSDGIYVNKPPYRYIVDNTSVETPHVTTIAGAKLFEVGPNFSSVGVLKSSKTAGYLGAAGVNYQDQQKLSVGILKFVLDSTATGSSSIGVDGVAVYGEAVSPAHFGATTGITTDSFTEVQAAASYVKASWNAANWAFDHTLDFLGEVYRSDTSIDFSGIRQPSLTVRNGQLYSRASGEIAFDMAGTNSPIIDDFTIFGAQDASPAWGLYIGRALISGAYGGVDGAEINGKSKIWGYFSRGCLLSLGAEVTNYSNSNFQNKYRDTRTCGVACVDNMSTISDRFGSETTSIYQTLPNAASGRHSNITHNFGSAQIRNASDVQLGITSITQANPAVVTVTSGTLAGANISNGDIVFISGGTMTEVKYKTFAVQNINEGSDTFELSGVDSTAYAAYTGGGSLQLKTGVALVTAGVKNISIYASYLLSYGSPSIEIDLDNGGFAGNWDVDFQSERHTDKQITFTLTSGTVVCQQLNITCANISQSAETSIMWVEGGGIVRIDGGKLVVANMSSAPSGGALSPAAQFNLQGFDISMPIASALNNPNDFAAFEGRLSSFDGAVTTTVYGEAIADVGQILMSPSSTLTSPGIRYSSNNSLGFYRDEVSTERNVLINDVASATSFNSVTNAINTKDKYAGKMAWDVTTSKPVFSTGAAASAVWNDSSGTLIYTPV